MEIGKTIKRLRVERGFLTAKSLAVASDVSPSTIADWEAGRRKLPGLDHLIHIASALGVTLGDLVDEEGWVTIPEELHVAALAEDLSYAKVLELRRAWPVITRLLNEAPGAMTTLVSHPQVVQALLNAQSDKMIRTPVLSSVKP